MHVCGSRETGVLVVFSCEDFMYVITEWWNYSENVAILA